MKALILALALLLAPMGASANQTDEQCLMVSTHILFAAMGRDLGSHPQDIIDGLVDNGVPLEGAVAIVKFIFINMPNASPDLIATTYFNFCTSEAA